MKTVWVLNYRDDYWADNDITIYANKEDAIKEFTEIAKEHENDKEFSLNEKHYEASWENKCYYCGVSVWEEEVLYENDI